MTNQPVQLGELLEKTIAVLVRQIDECNERIGTLEAERARLLREVATR